MKLQFAVRGSLEVHRGKVRGALALCKVDMKFRTSPGDSPGEEAAGPVGGVAVVTELEAEAARDYAHTFPEGDTKVLTDLFGEDTFFF